MYEQSACAFAGKPSCAALGWAVTNSKRLGGTRGAAMSLRMCRAGSSVDAEEGWHMHERPIARRKGDLCAKRLALLLELGGVGCCASGAHVFTAALRGCVCC